MENFIVRIREVREGDFEFEAESIEQVERMLKSGHEDGGKPLAGPMGLYTEEMTASIQIKGGEEEKAVRLL